MSSAARSADAAPRPGPVAVCVDRPVLSLDRPFTYELPEGLDARVGSLVQVPFHGRAVRGWVLGPTNDLPKRMAPIRAVVSPIPQFDERMLELFRWMSVRYVAPLASIIRRSSPPRVAGEETEPTRGASQTTPSAPGSERVDRGRPSPLSRCRNGDRLLRALAGGAGAFVVRPGPDDEAAIAVECVRATLASGRTAIVIVPEADPLPATAAAIGEAFGDAVEWFLGGDRRARYRTWIDIRSGSRPVVIGTRPAVFAPVPDLGLVFVHREAHAGHRDERSPRFHARDVARARAELEGAVCVLESFAPSLEAVAGGGIPVETPGRPWAPVEVVAPGPEGRSPRLLRALAQARRAFVYEPLRGYGVARVCRSCGESAACAECRGTVRMERGSVRCAVCGAEGRCATCGSNDFGIARGGAERVEEWARTVTRVPVQHLEPSAPARPPADPEVLVGGVDTVKDFGPLGLDLVAILNADLSLRRPGLAARERALTTWFEAAAWARRDGRVIVQTAHPNDPAVQALVAGRPARFHRAESARLEEAGFPAGAAVFRVVGDAELESVLDGLPHHALLVSSTSEATVCLLALDPADVARFGEAMRRCAERGVVSRVEAEPHV